MKLVMCLVRNHKEHKEFERSYDLLVSKGPSRIVIIFIYDNYYRKRGGGGQKMMMIIITFFSMRKVPLVTLRQKGITVLVIYCPFWQLLDWCLCVIEQFYNLILLFYLFISHDGKWWHYRKGRGGGGQIVMIVIIIDENYDYTNNIVTTCTMIEWTMIRKK